MYYHFPEGTARLPAEVAGIHARDQTDKINRAAAAARSAFSATLHVIAIRYAALGIEDAAAREFTQVVVAAVEGAMVTSRALRSPGPFNAVRAVLRRSASFRAVLPPGRPRAVR